MTIKVVPLFILLIISLLAGTIGRYVYQFVYDILSLQIVVYSWFLEAQQQLALGQGELEHLWDQAMELFGKASSRQEDLATPSSTEKLLALSRKIRFIAGMSGVVVAVLARHIAFSIVFRVKKYIHDIGSFVRD